MPTIGKVYGKVLDASTGKPAEFATVAVHQMGNDSLVGGAIVRGNGDFSVEKLPMGRSKVTVTFIGYRPLEREVTITRETLEQDLGDLMLEVDAALLNEVEVVGDRDPVIMQVDRRVFNVDKDLSIQGGTGVDVMKNIPGLSVDVEGNVEMRGSRPQILVDGRPTSMELEQIPSEEIERIEVITNPSVAFDASTTGGIINVILKKNLKPGYFGQVQAGAGTNGRLQSGFNVNAREGRWGFNLSYNYNTSDNLTNGDTRRTDLLNGAPAGYFQQDTESRSGRTMNGGRFGVDWQMNNRNLLSLSFNARRFERSSDDQQDFTTTTVDDELISLGTQVNTNRTVGRSTGAQLALRHTSPKPGKEWTMDINYGGWGRDSEARFDLNSYTASGDELPESPRVQDNIGGSTSDRFTYQADFANPIGERSKLEFGAKANYALDHTYLDVYLTNPEVGGPNLDSALTNDFEITDMINAVYFNWSYRLNDRWTFMAGFRFEQTWYEVELRGKDQRFSYRYPDGTQNLAKALFPAAYLVRKWEDSDRELQVNFSRKIDRPRHWQITPFIHYSDSRNIRIGNPTLAPELSNLAEVNHLLPFLGGRASWLVSVYGRYTEDVITSYASPLPSEPEILLSTFVNGDFSANGGVENILKFDPVKALQMTLSGTFHYTDVALSSGQGATRNQGTNWSAKAMINYRFRKDWVFQLNGEYESPEVLAQGKTLSQYGIDLSLSHEFDKHWSVVASVNDVFFTRRWGSVITTDHLEQESFRRREQRNMRVTLTWKFGERDASLFRRRPTSRGDAGGGGDMDL